MATPAERIPQSQVNRFSAHAGRAKWATVHITTDFGTFVGRLYVPESKRRVSDVLSDDRPFLNLTEVTIGEGSPVESFVAINKSHIRIFRVLHDGAAEIVPTPPRFV